MDLEICTEGQQPCFGVLAARIAPEVCVHSSSNERRAQGDPQVRAQGRPGAAAPMGPVQ